VSVVTATLLPDPPERQHEEDDLQRAVVNFLDWALPADGTVMAILNGGKRSKIEAARLVGLGVRKGAPDLLIVYRGTPIFIELKALHGVVRRDQREMHEKLMYCGAIVLVCRTLEGVINALMEMGVRLRATVMA
jgi:hypothetical protein